MGTRHTITADITVKFLIPGMPPDERECTDIRVDITYDFTRGSPAFYNRSSGSWDPPDPHEIELVEAVLVEGGGLSPTGEQVDEWAGDWLADAGYEAAVAQAVER